MKILFSIVMFISLFVHSAEIYIHYDAKWGNSIAIRGDSASLNWDKGQETTWLAGNVWKFETPATESNFYFKPLINDEVWSVGKNYFVEDGNSVVHIYPFFYGKKGKLEIIPSFSSQILGNQRALRIYLPPSYEENTEKHYPVLYMHDGQNLFDAATAFGGVEWRVDETSDKMVISGQIAEAIIVGMDNTGAHRLKEYTPEPDPNYGGGQGDLYLQFIKKEVMPFINQNYRTLTGAQNSFLMGSSLGGLISFHAGWTQSETFGSVACLSSSFWWNDESLTEKVSQASKMIPINIYIDSGDAKDGAVQTERMRQTLLNLGYEEGKNLFHLLDPSGKHSESSWASRLHIPLKFLLGK